MAFIVIDFVISKRRLVNVNMQLNAFASDVEVLHCYKYLRPIKLLGGHKKRLVFKLNWDFDALRKKAERHYKRSCLLFSFSAINKICCGPSPINHGISCLLIILVQ